MPASSVHLKMASERLGHSNIGITLDLSGHALPNMQADAAAIVDDALRAAQSARRLIRCLARQRPSSARHAALVAL